MPHGDSHNALVELLTGHGGLSEEHAATLLNQYAKDLEQPTRQQSTNRMHPYELASSDAVGQIYVLADRCGYKVNSLHNADGLTCGVLTDLL